MKIWLIKEGEPLPVDENPRLVRMGMLAKYLSEKEHEVIWWSSSFEHATKKYRCEKQKKYNVNQHEELILLHSEEAYTKNISFRRIKYHKRLAEEFKKETKSYEIPDIIISAYPTIQFAEAAIEYGKKNNVPVILDVRDLWPDIFKRALPEKLQWTMKLPLLLLQYKTKKTFKQATGLLSVVPSALDWGLNKAGRKKTDKDQCIYIGLKKEEVEENVLNKALEEWNTRGVSEKTWNICFFSTLSKKSIDLDTVFEAVEQLSKSYPEIRLIICGEGDDRKRLEEVAKNIPNIIFAGWTNQIQMLSLMKISKVGLYPLRNTEDFKNAFSNKAIQYMSEGVPILSDLQGFSKIYIEKYQVGWVYQEGSAKDCACKIKELIEYDNEKMNVIKENTRQRFSIDFDYNVVNEQFERYLKMIIECE